jgi:PKHD-type hydroxylase
MAAMLHIEGALEAPALARVRAGLDGAAWIDGRATAGNLSGGAKKNRQLSENDPLAAELGAVILDALSRNPVFVSAALPAIISPPIFNCYALGEEYGDHIDGAIRPLARGRMRTDLSVTVFLDDPEDYDGGDLVVSDLDGDQVVKLPAGDLILYEASSIHHVAPVIRGRRRAAILWVQSLVRDAAQRATLYALDQSIQRLREIDAAKGEVLPLTAAYHNLLRMWAEP